MKNHRFRLPSLGSVGRFRGKALIASAVILAIGVASVAIGAGWYWAVAFASIGIVLMVDRASSWNQARLQTERFQQLRNRLDALTKGVSSTGRAAPSRQATTGNARAARPVATVMPSPAQMHELQREIDYLLWRLSSAHESEVLNSQSREPRVQKDLTEESSR